MSKHESKTMIHYNLDEIQQSFRLLTTSIIETIKFKGTIIYELDAGFCFKGEAIPVLSGGYDEESIGVYNHKGKIMLVFLESQFALEVIEVKILKGELVDGFDGFELNKEFEIKNGQIVFY